MPTKILSDLIVTGTRTKHDTVQNFFRSSAFITTEGLMGKLSGLTLIRRGAYGEDPSIRGLGNGQINVTIDGMRMFSACTDRMDPVSSYLDAMNLSGVDGITDVEATAFGSTFGGSLNMLLRNPQVNEKVSGVAGFQLGSASRSVTTFGTVNASRKSSAYRLNVTHRKAGNYRSGEGARVLYSQFEKLQAAIGGKWATGEHDTLTAEAIADDGWNIGFPALPMDVGSSRARIYALTFERATPWWIMHSVKAKGYHNRLKHTMDDSARPDVAMPMDMPGASYTTGMFVEGDVHVFHNHSTKMKVEYFTNTSRAEMIMYPVEGSPMYMQTAPEATSQNIGYYLEQRYNFNDNRLTFTLRTDVASQRLHEGPGRDQWAVMEPETGQQFTEVVSTAAVAFFRKPSRNTSVNIQASYGERAPTVNERFGYYLFNRFDGYDYLGNPGLDKEKALSTDGTFQWFLNRFEWSASPYYKRINNYIFSGVLNDISAMTPDARGVKQYSNHGHANIAGADIMILARPHRSVQSITTIKYTRGTIKGEPLPLISPLKIVSSMIYSYKVIVVQADVEYASAQNQVNRFFGEQETPAFWIVGIRAGWKRESWQLNAGVENLFDRNYREHLDWGGIPRPGRNFYVNVNYRF